MNLKSLLLSLILAASAYALAPLFLPLPTLTPKELSSDGVLAVDCECGYIAHDADQKDTWVFTTRDHCRLLQEEAIDTWWDDTIVEMQDRGEL